MLNCSGMRLCCLAHLGCVLAAPQGVLSGKAWRSDGDGESPRGPHTYQTEKLLSAKTDSCDASHCLEQFIALNPLQWVQMICACVRGNYSPYHQGAVGFIWQLKRETVFTTVFTTLWLTPLTFSAGLSLCQVTVLFWKWFSIEIINEKQRNLLTFSLLPWAPPLSRGPQILPASQLLVCQAPYAWRIRE